MIHEGTVNGAPALIETDGGSGGDVERVALIPEQHALRCAADGQIVGVVNMGVYPPRRFDPEWREPLLNDVIQITRQTQRQDFFRL